MIGPTLDSTHGENTITCIQMDKWVTMTKKKKKENNDVLHKKKHALSHRTMLLGLKFFVTTVGTTKFR